MADLRVSTPGKATLISGIINLMNTILGAGLLSIPYAIKSNGVTLGVLLVVLSALTSAFGLYLLGVTATYAIPGHASFFALSKLTVPQIGIVFDLAIAVKCFGVGCSYLIVIGDLMPQIMKSLLSDRFAELHGYLLDRSLWITVFLVGILPLVYRRHLDSLKTTSLVALGSVGYLAVLVVIHFIHLMFGGTEDVPRGQIHLLKPNSIVTVLSSFPILVFGFTCQQNQFTVVNELQDRSSSRINKIIVTAIGTSFLLYLTVGLAGYFTFGDNVVGNIITMYPDSPATTFGRIAIVVLVSLSYPLQLNPARTSINHVTYYLSDSFFAKSIRSLSRSTTASLYSTTYEERRNLVSLTENVTTTLVGTATEPLLTMYENTVGDDNMDMEMQTEGEYYVELTQKKLIIITTSIVVCSYAVVLTVTSLEHVLAFVGSTGSTSISFILPGFFAFKLIDSKEGELTTKENVTKWSALVLVIWGFVVMIVCLSVTIFFRTTH